jgi:hypothetical protein
MVGEFQHVQKILKNASEENLMAYKIDWLSECYGGHISVQADPKNVSATPEMPHEVAEHEYFSRSNAEHWVELKQYDSYLRNLIGRSDAEG